VYDTLGIMGLHNLAHCLYTTLGTYSETVNANTIGCKEDKLVSEVLLCLMIGIILHSHRERMVDLLYD
jgi:hypothetical protein